MYQADSFFDHVSLTRLSLAVKSNKKATGVGPWNRTRDISAFLRCCVMHSGMNGPYLAFSR